MPQRWLRVLLTVAASELLAALHEFASDKVRRIAANIAKLPGLAR